MIHTMKRGAQIRQHGSRRIATSERGTGTQHASGEMVANVSGVIVRVRRRASVTHDGRTIGGNGLLRRHSSEHGCQNKLHRQTISDNHRQQRSHDPPVVMAQKAYSGSQPCF